MKQPNNAPAYALAYPVLAEAARSVGYALALHGTLNRDCDLVAIPWTYDAQDINALLIALTTQACLEIVPSGHDSAQSPTFSPSEKPHGRFAYTLRFRYGGGASFDLSVMPRDKAATAAREKAEADRSEVLRAADRICSASFEAMHCISSFGWNDSVAEVCDAARAAVDAHGDLEATKEATDAS